MAKILLLIAILGVTLVAITEAQSKCKLNKKKLKKKVKKFDSCLGKGYQADVNQGCSATGEGSLSKKQKKRCAKVEKAVMACGHVCSVNGGWGDYGEWSKCSTSCGGGTKTRSRNCSAPAPANGGAECEGDAEEAEGCNTEPCPVDGGWSNYRDWSKCSTSCGEGTKTRSRTCSAPAPANGGAECEGDAEEAEGCNTEPCPVDGGWSNYRDWSKCSTSCGGGTKTRSRNCSAPAPANGGAECEGDAEEAEGCNTEPCPVDGGWSNYRDWSKCSTSCGGGTKTRSRTCSAPAPANGGAECEGDAEEAEVCNTEPCPVDGGWSNYGGWSQCSASCAGGTQSRSRSCTNPAPVYGGANCQGQNTVSQYCNTQRCPVNGGWSNYGGWSQCSASCAGGTQSRTRSCTNPAPVYGGANCQGRNTVSQYCNTQSCPLPSWPRDFRWSSSHAGVPGDFTCIHIHEAAEPFSHTWRDNFFCWRNGKANPGLRWSSAGAIHGQKCTKIHEAADPHTWDDNFLCVPHGSPYNFRWSSAGPIAGLHCIQWLETADPHTWHDNYLCN